MPKFKLFSCCIPPKRKSKSSALDPADFEMHEATSTSKTSGSVPPEAGRLKKRTKPNFPKSLEEFGYSYNKNGELRNTETGKKYDFQVKPGDQGYNQKHYEALGETITDYIYGLLETRCHLEKIMIPVDAEEDETQTFVFASNDAFWNNKLMILIHGSGVVRAGQWARRLIINDCLDSGTQIPFIERAISEGYGVLVMNTNDNRHQISDSHKFVTIRGSEDPESHARYVWRHLVATAKAKHIAIVAHSYGGVVTTRLYRDQEEDFVNRVFAIAMTDSVHSYSSTKQCPHLLKVARNWVSSKKPLDTLLDNDGHDIRRVSSGVNVHEETSWSSFESIFNFFERKLMEIREKENGGEESSVGESVGETFSVGESVGETFSFGESAYGVEESVDVVEESKVDRIKVREYDNASDKEEESEKKRMKKVKLNPEDDE